MSGQMLLAIVNSVSETRKGPKVWLQVFRGELAEGDEVEVRHADGTVEKLTFVDVGKKPITPESFAGVGAVSGSGPFKQVGTAQGTFRVGDLLRSPEGPPAEVDSQSTLAAEAAAARAAGLNVAGPHLSDDEIALHVQWIMARAVKNSKGLLTSSGAYSDAGKVLVGYGLIEQGDRATLLASALLEGYEPSPGTRGLASLGAGVLGTFSFDTPMLISAVGLAMEEGDAFAKSYRNSLRVTGAGLRTPLMEQGRVVALGWCRKCGDIVELNAKLRCETCGKESESYRVVVPSDREAAEAELRAEGAPRKKGLFGW